MARNRRLDLYAECNVEPRAPLDVFTAECCSRCVNPDCSRSHFGGSKFEGRITGWYERLFSNVPRMLPDDPRFGKLAGQKFLLVDPAAPAVTASWVDPRELETRLVVPATPLRTEESPALVPPRVEVPEAVSAVVETPEAGPVTTSASPDLALKNTPASPGQMLGNRPKPTAPDWRPPQPSEPLPEARVVKTGAKIRIGS